METKTKTKLVNGMSLLMALFLLPTNVFAYKVNNEFNLAQNEGSSQVATNKYVILHETANSTATGRNEAQYMKRSWNNAYTAYIVGDGGVVYKVGEPGYVQYGAGSYANANSPVQIELQHSLDPATFAKNYKSYVELARDSAKKYGIPLTLDTPYDQPGIKSHLWVTQNIWGDHSDPYGYLAKMGVSKEKLAYDLANGFGNDNPAPTPSKPTPPTDNNQYKAETGQYTFSVDTKIRNGVGLSGQDSGLIYGVGDTVTYDRIYDSVDGYKWLSYMSYSGTRRYVAMIQGSSSNSSSGISQAAGVAYANQMIGNSYDFDGAYGVQCFDLINQYAYKLFGTSFSGAGAIDLMQTGNKNGFHVISRGSGLPQAGDIFIYRTYHNQWGHTGVVLSADSTGMWMVDQNYSGNGDRATKRYVRYDESWGTLTGWIRPPWGSGATSQPSQPTETGWIEENATFYPNTTINVRSAASTSSQVIAQYNAGQSVRYNAKKVSGGYVWIRYTADSGNQRYMAVRTVTNSVRGQLWGTIY